MPQVSLSGQDTLQIAGRNFTAFVDGDYATCNFPNETVALKTGKNGNTIYAYDFRGQNANLDLRIIRGSADDQFLQNIYVSQESDLASFALIVGQFVKRIGNGKSMVINDTYKLSGGVIVKRVDAKSNAEGDTEQSISIWHLRFSSAERIFL